VDIDVRETPSGRWTARIICEGVSHYVGVFRSQLNALATCQAEIVKAERGTSTLVVPGTVPARAFAEAIGVRLGTVKRWIHEGMPVRGTRVHVKDATAWVREHHGDSVAFNRRAVVYVAQRDGDGAVKIGWTSDLARRLHELRRDTQVDVLVLAALPGDKPVEQRLHERFAPKRLDGEWFAVPAAEAVAALREVA
jgi:hypothetical protein